MAGILELCEPNLVNGEELWGVSLLGVVSGGLGLKFSLVRFQSIFLGRTKAGGQGRSFPKES